MAYRTERAADADRDLDALFDFLYDVALGFGEGPDRAYQRASACIRTIDQAISALGRAPRQGTLRPEIMPGLRNITKDRAILYFMVDDVEEVVRVVAVFFGGQDHTAAMLKRIKGGRERL